MLQFSSNSFRLKVCGKHELTLDAIAWIKYTVWWCEITRWGISSIREHDYWLRQLIASWRWSKPKTTVVIFYMFFSVQTLICCNLPTRLSIGPLFLLSLYYFTYPDSLYKSFYISLYIYLSLYLSVSLSHRPAVRETLLSCIL